MSSHIFHAISISRYISSCVITEVKRPVPEDNHSASTIEVKITWIYLSTSPLACSVELDDFIHTLHAVGVLNSSTDFIGFKVLMAIISGMWRHVVG